MFDNLRESASSFYESDQKDSYKEQSAASPSAAVASPRRNTRFLGMTAQQRFIIALMLMLTLCIVGTLAMLVLGKMSF